MKRLITIITLTLALAASVFAEKGYILYWDTKDIEKVEIERGENFQGIFFFKDPELGKVREAHAWYWHNGKMVWDDSIVYDTPSVKEAFLQMVEKAKNYNPDWDGLTDLIESINNTDFEEEQ